MGLAEQSYTSSWVSGPTPVILSDVFSEDISVALWSREQNHDISRYFEQVFGDLGMGVRGVFSMNSLKTELAKMLPEHNGREQAVEDVYLLADMLTCLFNCESVGVRLTPLTSAMCPKLHVDNVPVRLVNTYLGPGTQWLPTEALQSLSNGANLPVNTKSFKDAFYDPNDIQQMKAFEVGLLKGLAWEQHEQMAAIHRSCQVAEGEKRVLLTLDPL